MSEAVFTVENHTLIIFTAQNKRPWFINSIIQFQHFRKAQENILRRTILALCNSMSFQFTLVTKEAMEVKFRLY